MKLIPYFVLCFLIITTIACKKTGDTLVNQVVEDKSLFNILSTKNVKTDGNISITAANMSFAGALPSSISIDAFCKDKNGNAAPLEKLQINQHIIPEETYTHYTAYFNNNRNASDYPAVVASLFGNNLNINLESKAFGNVITQLYSPSVLKMDLSDIQNDILLKRKGLTIKWDSDKILAQRSPDAEQLGVAIVYHAGYQSNKIQTGLPTQNVTVFKFVNESTGQVTFTPAELAQLPDSGYGAAYLARANQTIVPSSTGQTIGITSFVMSSSQEIQFQ
ncbi:MAG: hypothetical protein RIS64_2138 [Bacteroidota bacterium]|jgi:hypothetical protein